MLDQIVAESTTDTLDEIAAGLKREAVAPEPPAEEPAPLETAAPETPAAAAVADPALTTTDAPAPVAPVKKLTKAQQLLADATAKAAQAETQRLAAETEAATLRAQLAARTPPIASPAAGAVDTPIPAALQAQLDALGPKPTQEDFEDYGQYEEKRDGWIEARAVVKTRIALAQEQVAAERVAAQADAQRAAQQIDATFLESKQAAEARHADYQAVMQAATHVIAGHVKAAVLDADHAGEVVYALAKDPALTTRLNGLSAAKAAIEIGRLSDRLGADLPASAKPAGAVQTGATSPAPARVQVSTAPEPQGTMLGGSSGQIGSSLEGAETQAEYVKRRRAMKAARTGRS